jgi:hypothetical protein
MNGSRVASSYRGLSRSAIDAFRNNDALAGALASQPGFFKAIDRKLLASIERIARSYEPALRDAFLTAIRSARSNASIEAIAEAIQSMNPGQAIRAATVGLEYDKMRDTLADIIEAAGNRTTAAIATEVGPVRGVQIAGFDVVNPYAVGYARTEVGRLIRGIDMRTREGIQNLIGNAIETGIAPREAAKVIRGQIGLTEFQTDYVMNYQSKLIAEGASNIDAKVQRYADKVLRQRALTISRSETLRASNAGQQAAWRAAIDQGFLDSDVEQIWIAHPGCEEICQPMPEMEQNQHVRIGGMFLTGEGSYVRQPPAHPNCRCTIALNV